MLKSPINLSLRLEIQVSKINFIALTSYTNTKQNVPRAISRIKVENIPQMFVSLVNGFDVLFWKIVCREITKI